MERLRVANELENFGVRVQFSVFECHLDDAELQDLQRRLAPLIDEKEDRLRYYPLCDKDRSTVMVDGIGTVSRDWDYHVV